MIDGKWHLRLVRGTWQGVMRKGYVLRIVDLPIQNPAFYLCHRHGPVAIEQWEAKCLQNIKP